MFDCRGKTALVTGASAGIGREVARVLARDVGTLVLVARRRDRLDELAAELRRDSGDVAIEQPQRSVRPHILHKPFMRAARGDGAPKVEVRALDLTDRAATAKFCDELAERGPAVDVLINNAGFGDRGLFESGEWATFERMLDLNVVASTQLLRRFVPPMVRRGSGAVLNVGSTAGLVPLPDSAVYSASKAYLNILSEAVRAEVAGTGVSVTALLPGPVETEFQGVSGFTPRPRTPGIFWVDVVACAEEAVAAMKRGDARVIPGRAVHAAALAAEAIPRRLMGLLLDRVAKGIRRARS